MIGDEYLTRWEVQLKLTRKCMGGIRNPSCYWKLSVNRIIFFTLLIKNHPAQLKKHYIFYDTNNDNSWTDELGIQTALLVFISSEQAHTFECRTVTSEFRFKTIK